MSSKHSLGDLLRVVQRRAVPTRARCVALLTQLPLRIGKQLMQSPSPTPGQMETLENHVKGQGKISQLIQLSALGWLSGNEGRQAKVDQAERNWYIKQLGEPVGNEGKETTGKMVDEEMRNIVLGDVNHPAPVVVPQQPSNLLPIALLALAAAVPTTGAIGVAGYLLANRPQPAPTQPAFDDSTVRIGLSRFDDLKQDDKK